MPRFSDTCKNTHARTHTYTHTNARKHTHRGLLPKTEIITCRITSISDTWGLSECSCSIKVEMFDFVETNKAGERSWWRRCEELVTEVRLLRTFRPLSSSDSHLCSNIDKRCSNLFDNRHKCWALNNSQPASLTVVGRWWYSGGWLTWIYWSI